MPHCCDFGSLFLQIAHSFTNSADIGTDHLFERFVMQSEKRLKSARSIVDNSWTTCAPPPPAAMTMVAQSVADFPRIDKRICLAAGSALAFAGETDPALCDGLRMPADDEISILIQGLKHPSGLLRPLGIGFYPNNVGGQRKLGAAKQAALPLAFAATRRVAGDHAPVWRRLVPPRRVRRCGPIFSTFSRGVGNSSGRLKLVLPDVIIKAQEVSSPFHNASERREVEEPFPERLSPSRPGNESRDTGRQHPNEVLKPPAG